MKCIFRSTWKAMKITMVYILFPCTLILPGCTDDKKFFVIKNCNLIPMTTNKVLYNRTVWIRNNKIEKIDSGIQVITQDINVVDAQGGFLMPGLTDAHVHIFAPHEFHSYLYFGVTTVLNMDGSPRHLKWREQIKTGELTGPRMYTAGHTIDGNIPMNWMFWTVETAEQAQEAIEFQKKAGYDFVKLYGTLNPEIYEALVEKAASENMVLVGHLPRQYGFKNAIENGFRLIAHGEEILATAGNFQNPTIDMEAVAQQLKKNGTYVTPNSCIPTYNKQEAFQLDSVLASSGIEFLSLPAYTQRLPANNRLAEYKNNLEFAKFQDEVAQQLQSLIRALQKNNVPIVSGSDASTIGLPGRSLHEELLKLVEAGLTPYEALRTATINSSDFIQNHIDSAYQGGTGTVGALANLILLKDNPLQNIQALNSIQAVYIGNKWLTTKQLKDTIDLLTKDNQQYKIIRKMDSLISLGKLRDVAGNKVMASTRDPVFAQWVIGEKARQLSTTNPEAALLTAEWNTTHYPEHFASWNELGKIQFGNEQWNEARQSFNIADSLAPGNSAARSFLEKLTDQSNTVSNRWAGAYQLVLEKKPNAYFPPSDSLLIEIKVLENEATLFLKSKHETTQLKPFITKDKLWVIVPTQVGEREVEFKIEQNEIKGYWRGRFGFNGLVSGKKH